MNNWDKILFLARILLKDKFPDFQKNFPEFDRKSEEERLPRDCYYISELIRNLADSNLLIWMPWTGEENSGETAEHINRILNDRGEPTFEWDVDKFFEVEVRLARGEHSKAIFKALDRVLKKRGQRITLLEYDDDYYHYTVVNEHDFEQIRHWECDFGDMYGEIRICGAEDLYLYAEDEQYIYSQY